MISPIIKRRIRKRAGDCCEYWQIHRSHDVAIHHVDHVVARKHGGSDDDSNLCWACATCSLCKGSNLSGRDSRTSRTTRLFNPRADRWASHFRWKGAILEGRPAIGRARIAVLNINRQDRQSLREALIANRQFPPEVEQGED